MQPFVVSGITVGALFLVVACSDKPTELPPLKLQAGSPAAVVESDGFYLDPADGKYFWDRTEPEYEPAIWPVIGQVLGEVQVPTPRTNGWVGATVYYSYADVAKFELEHDAFYQNGNTYYSNYPSHSGWRAGAITMNGGCQRNCAQNMTFRAPLSTGQSCGIGITMSGKATAAMGIPFGISVNVFKPSVEIGVIWTTWKDVEAPVPQTVMDAYDCDLQLDYSCDVEGTTEIEQCPMPGDPSNTPTQIGGWGNSEIRPISNPEPGGATREYCEWTHYWVSKDGGQTWKYWYSEFNGCVDLE